MTELEMKKQALEVLVAAIFFVHICAVITNCNTVECQEQLILN